MLAQAGAILLVGPGPVVEFILSPESYYAKRLDGLTTVYLGQESGQIVGSRIKGVRHFVGEILKNSPGFRVEIQDGRIRLKHLFTAKLWSERTSGAQEEVYLYQFLRKKAEEANAEVVFPELAAA